jgi:hypothetical protein
VSTSSVANNSTPLSDLAVQQVATFRKQTGKRKFSLPFEEDGAWWIIDSQGHQWGWCDEYGEGFAWVCFTEDDDEFVLETKREKRTTKRAA